MDLCKLLVSRRDTPMCNCWITPSFSCNASISILRNLTSLSVVFRSLTPRESGTKCVATLSRYPNRRRRIIVSSLRSPVWGARFGGCVVASMCGCDAVKKSCDLGSVNNAVVCRITLCILFGKAEGKEGACEALLRKRGPTNIEQDLDEEFDNAVSGEDWMIRKTSTCT